ncbi:glycoside hydrolase TIM-barrel-like domain-containing protein, partial [Mariniflexile sp.]|uniref:baseplate megatron protein TIM-barrel domain-containing protein n=1 Tax=Mariniflexile sp. TaxID=1979402 RepID=UPI003568343A
MSVFPLNIPDKEDHPDKVAKLEGVDSKYYQTAYEINRKKKAIEELKCISTQIQKQTETLEGLESQIKSINLVPSSGEGVYSTTEITVPNAGDPYTLNKNFSTDLTDFEVSMQSLAKNLPNNKTINLVVSWFGSDLRIGECKIQPKAKNNYDVFEHPYKKFNASESSYVNYDWLVSGINRASADYVSITEGVVNFGGTPTDYGVLQSIVYAIKVHQQNVAFYPFLLMDIPEDNTMGQPVFPWRGRMYSPNDKTPLAETDINTFFGTISSSDFSLDEVNDKVLFTGNLSDYTYRRMILHYAWLYVLASKQLTEAEKLKLSTFYIGSELRGLTQTRSTASSVQNAVYPAVEKLSQLADDVKAVFNANGLSNVKIGYAADWSEYHSHKPNDGSGDVYFNMDKLWSNPNIAKVSIDNYLPLSDWRDSETHEDFGAGLISKYNVDGVFATNSFPRGKNIYDYNYLMGQIEGGEYFHYYYASESDREQQIRTIIEDGLEGKHWIYRQKDIRNWWKNKHYDRPGGIPKTTPTNWTPEAKQIAFSEFGCGAINKGTNQPNVFLDPKSSESLAPHFSNSNPDVLIQRAYFECMINYWSLFGDTMINVDDMIAWAWDARGDFWTRSDIWVDAVNYDTGHWLNGRAGTINTNQL